MKIMFIYFQRENIKCSSLRLLESKNKYVCPIKTYTIITIFLHKNIMALKWYILQVPKLSQMQKKQSTEPKSTKLKYLINIMLSIIGYHCVCPIFNKINNFYNIVAMTSQRVLKM